MPKQAGSEFAVWRLRLSVKVPNTRARKLTDKYAGTYGQLIALIDNEERAGSQIKHLYHHGWPTSFRRCARCKKLRPWRSPKIAARKDANLPFVRSVKLEDAEQSDAGLHTHGDICTDCVSLDVSTAAGE